MLQSAQLRDRDAVEQLAQQVHALHVAWRPDIYESAEVLYPMERFREAVSKRELFVAKVGEEIIGYAAIKIRNYDWPGVVKRKVLLLDEICVREDCRGHGFGTQILYEIGVIAKTFGCSDLQLSVSLENDAAVAFYQKNGFSIRNLNMLKKL